MPEGTGNTLLRVVPEQRWQRCELLETYVDADALLAHFAGPAVQVGVPKMMATASVSGFEVYGDPGPKAKETLAKFGAEIFSYWHGLGR